MLRALPFTAAVTPITPGEVIATLLAPGLSVVTFRKRTTGEIRTMLCLAAWQGKGLASYDPLKKGLLRVYDVEADGYRMVPMESVISARKLDGPTTASAALHAYAA